MMINAVIFDLDGVILDTEKLYLKFWVEASAMCGYNMTREHALGIRSLASKFASEKLKKEVDPSFDIERVKALRIKLMDEYIDNYGVQLKDGVCKTLDYLKNKHIPMAIATSSPTQRTQSYLEKAGIYDKFDKIISAYMVKNGKPEPDIYIEAAKQLGFDTKTCLAIEDSPNGILSAYRAGCKTVMVIDQSDVDDEMNKLLYAKYDNIYCITNLI